MRLSFPDVAKTFDLDEAFVNTLVIENPQMMYRLLSQLRDQIDGKEGQAILASQGKPLDFPKNVELMTQFVPFDMNQKPLINRIISELEKNAVTDDLFSQTAAMISELEDYLDHLTEDVNASMGYTKLEISSILKAVGMEIQCDGETLCEKILEYIGLVNQYIGKKLFILYNLRSIVSDKEAELFIETVLSHGFYVMMIENCVHTKVNHEKQWVIDNEMCEIEM